MTPRDERDRAGVAARSLSALRKQIDEQVVSTERVIAALHEQVDELRRERRELVRERDELRRKVAKMTAVELQRAQTDDRDRVIGDQVRRARQTIRTLEADNERLAQRCAELETALADALAGNDELRIELDCVEKQVTELERIVALLNESDEG